MAKGARVAKRPSASLMVWLPLLLSLLGLVAAISLSGCADPAEPSPSFDCPEPTSDDDDSVGDDDDSAGDDDDNSTPANSPPGPPTVQLLPADAGVEDNLHCLVTEAAEDSDGDPISYRFSWLQDGAKTERSTSLLPAAETTYNEEWTCQVAANDGSTWGTTGSSAVRIGANNSPPTAPGLIIEPANAEVGSPLYCLIDEASEDADGDPVYYSFSWELNEVPSDYSGSLIAGDLVEDGDCWTCVVVPYDHTSVGPTAADTVCAAGGAVIPPTQPTVEIVLGPDGSLECVITVASEAPGDPTAVITYLFAWTVDGISTSVVVSEIQAGDTNTGETWTCSATPYDGFQFGDPGEDSFTIP